MSAPSLGDRSNAWWLAALHGDPPCESAVLELADFLRRGLARVLGPRARLQEHDLDDLVQEALLRVLDRLPSFRGDSRFGTWALAVATRTAFTELRRRSVRERDRETWDALVDEARVTDPRAAPRPAEALERGDLLATLGRLIETTLTERQRTAVAAELAGLPTVEIAARLGTNQNALYKLHHDARRKLRAGLERAGFSACEVRGLLAGGPL